MCDLICDVIHYHTSGCDIYKISVSLCDKIVLENAEKRTGGCADHT